MEKYLDEIKKLILEFFEGQGVKVILFGSRARGDHAATSDVDIGVLADNEISHSLTLLREKITNLNVPYKVELVDLGETSEEFRTAVLQEGIIWKD